jgi:aldehyde:ferredoxin oxidoreductase
MQVDLINAACGYDWSIADMMKVGERGWNMKRAVNNKLGLTASNDRLPKALLEPLPTGGSQEYVPEIQAMLQAYYEARSWDSHSGYPTRQKLLDLGLKDVAQDLWG